MTVITRFAPSPTGPLHLGGARTALFNYIYAKSKNGKFKLRIEDTDQLRNKIETSNSIIESLNWLGIKYDDTPLYQSKNLKKHQEIAYSFIERGLAYKCFHSEVELENMRKISKKFQSKWRDKNINLPTDKKFCVRIKSPDTGYTEILDNIQGKVKIDNKEIDDFIILRSDASPTFLLSSAVDDSLMSVSDIIRGDDHLTNSFRQKIIFESLNYHPRFSHIPLIHNKDNQKLSKRDNVNSIIDYRNKGFMAESLVNYLIRMGWSHGDQEFFSNEQMISNFSLNGIGKSPSMIDEKKLYFFNNHYIKNSNDNEILEYLEKLNLIKNTNSQLNHAKLIAIFKDRAKTLLEISNFINSVQQDNFSYDESQKKILDKTRVFKDSIINEFTGIQDWNEYIIQECIERLLKKLQLKFKEIGQPLRLLITGTINGPSISKIMNIVGKEKVLTKIDSNW